MFSAAYLVWMADAGIQMLASIASSVIWLLLTSILWVNANSIFGIMWSLIGGIRGLQQALCVLHEVVVTAHKRLSSPGRVNSCLHVII